jgi:hypothetical protein
MESHGTYIVYLLSSTYAGWYGNGMACPSVRQPCPKGRMARQDAAHGDWRCQRVKVVGDACAAGGEREGRELPSFSFLQGVPSPACPMLVVWCAQLVTVPTARTSWAHHHGVSASRRHGSRSSLQSGPDRVCVGEKISCPGTIQALVGDGCVSSTDEGRKLRVRRDEKGPRSRPPCPANR